MIRLLAVLGILGISFSAVFVRLAEVSPATAAFFRAAYALPPLFLLWAMTRGGDHRPASMRWMAAGSGLFLALDLTVWHRSIELIGAGLATVLANTQIVFVGLIAWAIHRERPTALAFATIPLVFGGVALISGLGRADAYGDDPLAGAALGVVTGMAYTGFLLVFRASNRELAPPAGPLRGAAGAGGRLAADRGGVAAVAGAGDLRAPADPADGDGDLGADDFRGAPVGCAVAGGGLGAGR